VPRLCFHSQRFLLLCLPFLCFYLFNSLSLLSLMQRSTNGAIANGSQVKENLCNKMGLSMDLHSMSCENSVDFSAYIWPATTDTLILHFFKILSVFITYSYDVGLLWETLQLNCILYSADTVVQIDMRLIYNKQVKYFLQYCFEITHFDDTYHKIYAKMCTHVFIPNKC